MNKRIKLKKLSGQGFRGILKRVWLDFEDQCKSLVLFGNNGDGKSSFTDVLEWFFTDKIEYLRERVVDGKTILMISYLKLKMQSLKFSSMKVTLITRKYFNGGVGTGIPTILKILRNMFRTVVRNHLFYAIKQCVHS